ncbi:MAG: LPP20 family lipoprotein [Candidatus Neomarinimicrobiota bacterium]
MQKNYSIKMMLILMGLILSSAGAQVPDWFKTNQHKKYPAARYFLGVAVATDKTEAIELARADVAKQIQVRIESELETVESEFKDNDKNFIKSETTSRTKSAVSETISGIEVAEVKEVKGKVYVLAVLNKEKYLSGLEVQMEDILTRSEQLVTAARGMVADGRILNALNNFIDAQNTIPDFYTKSALYTALSGRKYPNIDQFTGPGIVAEVREILAHIELQALAGNNQQAVTGKNLPGAIKVKVVYAKDGQTIGVAGFPVVAKYASGDPIAKRETGADGMTEFMCVATPTDNLGKTGTIKIALELTKIPEQFRDAMTRSEVLINYTLIASNLAFAVDVRDKSGKPQTVITDELVRLIAENGYTHSANAPIIVQGTLVINSQKEIPSPAGTQYLVEAQLQLRLVERQGSAVLAALDVNAKGLDSQSAEGASAKAARNIKIPTNKFAAFLQSANNNR